MLPFAIWNSKRNEIYTIWYRSYVDLIWCFIIHLQENTSCLNMWYDCDIRARIMLAEALARDAISHTPYHTLTERNPYFQTTITEWYANILKFFAEKMWVAFVKATHIFSAKNIRILCIESAKTVNEMTLNVKYTNILKNSSALWGFRHFSKGNMVQNRTTWYLLGVHRFTLILKINGDMGWQPSVHRRW